MALIESTAPSIEPLTVAELKAHLRLTFSDDDAYLAMIIKVARRSIEQQTNRAFINRSFVLYLNEWRGRNLILPIAPVQSVTHVKYYDADATLQTLSTDVYEVDALSTPSRVVLAYNQSWPTLDTRINAIQVTFIAGYGTTAATVPEELRQAIMLLASHYYVNREDVTSAPGTIYQIPKGVDFLVLPHKVWLPL